MIDPSIHDLGPGIHKNILYPGKGPLPKYQKDTKAWFHFRTFINNKDKTLLDDTRKWDEPFQLVMGHSFQLESWEKAVMSMRAGERSEFTCVPEKCVGYAKLSKTLRDIQKQKQNKDAIITKTCCGTQSYGYGDLDKITGESLIFEFDMLEIQQPGEYKKEIWTMSNEEKRKYALDQREQGNLHYKEKNLEKAEQCYARALGALEQLGLKEQPNSEDWYQIEDLKLPLLLNYSQVKINQKEYCEAIKHLNTVLKRDPQNVKGLYRRATAHAGCWNVDAAEQDWNRLAEVDPSQASLVTKKLQELTSAVKLKEKEEKNRLKGMF